MSIVKMRRMRVAAAEADRKKLFRALMRLGCVEISPPDPLLADEALSRLVTRGAGDARLLDRTRRLKNGMDTLRDIAHPKKSLLAPRQQVDEEELLDGTDLAQAEALAASLEERAAALRQLDGDLGRLDARIAQFTPWLALDAPLEWRGSRHTAVEKGTLPPQTELEPLTKALQERAPEAELVDLGADAEQRRVLLVSHQAAADEALSVLKEAGFSRVAFEETGTPRQVVDRLEKRREELAGEKEALLEGIRAQAGEMPRLERAWDMLLQEQAGSQEEEKLLHTRKAVYFEGWTPLKREPEVQQALERFGCAYEFSDPEEGDDVPIQLQNSRLVAPVSMVTEMYSLPAYDGIDPNPLIFPFFTVFFGIMYADLGYGIILFVLGLLGVKLLKPRGTMGQMLRLMVLCGVTTAVAGACFGGFFGDVITVVSRQLGHEVTLPALLFNPMEEPMTMMIVALGLGVVQIITGMLIKAYMCIRDGHPLDALFDVGSWFVLFAGLAVLALGGSWYVAAAGVAMLLLTQGRAKPTIIGKIIGGVSSLYDITSYLSDVLSYLRLMALVLATSVIASVVNTLGIMTGVVGFIIIFLVGHAFNMGVNIIGTYVHAARLQYLEFFGKFYKEGGRPFQPYQIRTKYVEVIKEEKAS